MVLGTGKDIMEEWEVKKLGEIFEIKPSKKEAQDKVSDNDFVTFLPMEDLGILNKDVEGTKKRQLREVSGSYTYFADNDLLLAKITPCFENGKIGIARNLVKGIGFGSSEYIVFRSKGLVVQEYLYYFLSRETFREEGRMQMTGAVGHKRVSKEFIENYPIPFPKSIQEQQRIVTILDEAFAAIDKVKANAERNLNNARELFESHLHETFKTSFDDFNSKELAQVSKIISGYAFSSKDFKPNNLLKSVKITNVGVREFIEEVDNYLPSKFGEIYKEFRVKENDIVIALTRTIISAGLKVAVIPNNYDGALLNQRVAAIVPNETLIDRRYLYIFLTTKRVTDYVLDHVNTLMQPNLSISDLKKMPVPLPNLENQKQIVTKVDLLSQEVEKLETIYQRQIDNLEELKRSLLQKAFSGELTASKPIAKVVELPVKYRNISAIDLQAGIVAFALQRHLEANKANTFGHVKAEKVVHLAEQMLNIDLERNPVKDAAGPNDFPHANKVQFRAGKVGFYNVRETEVGYKYTPGNQIQSIISKTQTVLDAKVDKLKWLVDLLVPMTTQQAEIIATVYAAWNNLLLNGKEITDEAIVTEAREDWHPDKLKIEREKFFNAIKWMKEVSLVPTGNGKQVLAKAAK